MTLEEVLQFVEAKESGKQSSGHLLQAQGVDAARSQYRSAKNTELKNCKLNNPNSDPCHYCGKHGHGRNSPARLRKLECPAYGKHCDHCGHANHFGAVSQAKSPGKQRPTPPNATTAEAEGAVFDALCMVNNSGQHQSACALTLDHHLYNDLNDCWVRKKSQPQPLITLTATLHPNDYKALGFQPSSLSLYNFLPWQIKAARAVLQAPWSFAAWALTRKTSSRSQHACMLPTTVASRSWVQSS